MTEKLGFELRGRRGFFVAALMFTERKKRNSITSELNTCPRYGLSSSKRGLYYDVQRFIAKFLRLLSHHIFLSWNWNGGTWPVATNMLKSFFLFKNRSLVSSFWWAVHFTDWQWKWLWWFTVIKACKTFGVNLR